MTQAERALPSTQSSYDGARALLAGETLLVVTPSRAGEKETGVIKAARTLEASGRVAAAHVLRSSDLSRAASPSESIVQRAFDVGATLIVFWVWHASRIQLEPDVLKKLARLPTLPTVGVTVGDAFMSGYLGRPEIPRHFRSTLRAADLVGATSMGRLADHLAGEANAPVMLLPSAVCDAQFGPDVPVTPAAIDADVVFIGAASHSKNPGRRYYWLGRQRQAAVRALQARFGSRLAVFGPGWQGLPSWRGEVDRAEQVRVAAAGQVVFSGVPFSFEPFYASDRSFIQATSGVPLVETVVPGLDQLLPSSTSWTTGTPRDVVRSVERVLEEDPVRRRERGLEARDVIFARHLTTHRLETFTRNLAMLRAGAGIPRGTLPFMPFFGDDAVVERQLQLVTRRWPW